MDKTQLEQWRRSLRAVMNLDHFVIVPAEQGSFYVSDQSTSCEAYTVSAASCTCPDHQYRCAGRGLRCKHRVALAIHQGCRAAVRCR